MAQKMEQNLETLLELLKDSLKAELRVWQKEKLLVGKMGYSMEKKKAG
jgi:hypothetical protein